VSDRRVTLDIPIRDDSGRVDKGRLRLRRAALHYPSCISTPKTHHKITAIRAVAARYSLIVMAARVDLND